MGKSIVPAGWLVVHQLQMRSTISVFRTYQYIRISFCPDRDARVHIRYIRKGQPCIREFESHGQQLSQLCTCHNIFSLVFRIGFHNFL